MKNLTMIVCALTATVILVVCAGTAVARIPEPDVIFYGEAIGSEGAVSTGVVSLRLSGSATPIVSYTLGSDPKANNRYVLRVPLDALDPRDSGTARSGEQAGIYLDGVLLKTVTIPARGSAVAVAADVTTVDSDKDGIPDGWEKRYFGTLVRDGTGDANRNGVSDLKEYQNGTDPLACVWTPVDDIHAVTAVYDAKVLQNCLSEAGRDGRHNLIKVSQGTYQGNFTYSTETGENFDLSLVGGYGASGSEVRSYHAALTVLDGDTDGDGVGNGPVLTIDADTSRTTGTIYVEGFHLKNGKAPDGGAGGGIQGKGYLGALELIGNMVSACTADSGGGVTAITESGEIFLANNVVFANTAFTAAGLQITTATGPVTIINNTVADNTGTASGSGQSLLVKSTGGTVDIANNIIRGTSASLGPELFVNSLGATISLQVRSNAFPASDGFMSTVPDFVLDASNRSLIPTFLDPATGNYRQKGDSPTIDAGLSTHPKLPAHDMDGDTRITGAAVDIGADERARGDLNDDGILNIVDALLTLQYAIGLIEHTPENNARFLAAADVAPLDSGGKPQGDGQVNVFDALAIIRHAVGLDGW